MKESKLFSIKNKKLKNDSSNLKPIPTRFKNNLISLKSLPNSQVIAGSKSFRQQARCFTQKNSKEKDKHSNNIENVSFELNSLGKERQKIKNKNLIMNTKNFLNYNSKMNSNYLNYMNPSTNNSNNNLLNINGNKQNLFYIQKIEEEPQQLRINTVINSFGQGFSASANNSISNKNKKNLNNPNFKLISCINGLTGGFKGAIKGYNTANNTANNSVAGSTEKNDKKEFQRKKSKKISGKIGKDFLKSKEAIKKINNNIEFNLRQKQNKNKFAHTTNNSRQNSGEKYLDITKSKLMALKHNKLILII